MFAKDVFFQNSHPQQLTVSLQDRGRYYTGRYVHLNIGKNV